ncbi:hypothetical protein TNCV_2782541 [Trichonephila clavipes]|nr:hypothetical protein TNCV_2782541 [Trichonephila clavipes]
MMSIVEETHLVERNKKIRKVPMPHCEHVVTCRVLWHHVKEANVLNSRCVGTTLEQTLQYIVALLHMASVVQADMSVAQNVWREHCE